VVTAVTDLRELVAVLRDEVLATAEHGDRDPPGAELFDALLRSLGLGADSGTGLDLGLHDAVARRLAWGDGEEQLLADAEIVFERLLVAVERAFRAPADQLAVIEAASEVAATLARVVALAAVGRANRDRAARLREEMTQRQLKEALEQQKASAAQLESELQGSDFQ
jgi:hypothetical protein